MQQNILIAGPCAAENESQILNTASLLSKQFSDNNFNLNYYRTGVWKPRAHPASFTGAGEKALPWLQKVQEQFGFPVCVEIALPEQFALCEKFGITAFWIGARTTVNPFLVDELCKAAQGHDYTIMLKNPIAPDLRLWIGAIERFQRAGINKIFAIHRGFSEQNESVLRNSPHWEIPIELKVQIPDIPLICDASHIAGDKQFLREITQLALDFNFDGMMLETHDHPEKALCDAKQQVTPQELVDLLKSLTFRNTASSPAEPELELLRRQIEHIDNQLGRLLAKRMGLMDSIAALKADHNLPIVDPKQFKRVIERYQQVGLKDDDYKEFIDKFLDVLHYHSIRRQQKFEGEA
ncbi:bifunctional 3-deoxy-7-phosphoheptulonate synthase/chorismate mutase type II [Bacteroidales bacterium OttesenSCG-928-C03]|nr:bifunctional 3-deoxy-7-phosphoheptulonate synthase/chorismate mutase type II [Bacteroidales bacterium OttesenSCG-928-C03]MDL2325882.1 bifunctional 3-deoxy-7-phosphoheptulonate synthase/chorismate mutase type II [Bacteroidales bacterium OttesenSCG-928-A14]